MHYIAQSNKSVRFDSSSPTKLFLIELREGARSCSEFIVSGGAAPPAAGDVVLVAEMLLLWARGFAIADWPLF